MRRLSALLILGLLLVAAADARRLQKDIASICVYCSTAGNRKTFTTRSSSVTCTYNKQPRQVLPISRVPDRAAALDRGCPTDIRLDGLQYFLSRAQDTCPTSTVTEC